MKKLFLKIFLLCIIVTIANCTQKSENKDVTIGIVSTKKLLCRQSPDINSSKITTFNFSNPLVLIDKSKSKTTINGLDDYWYQEKETLGWVFGGYLLIVTVKDNDFFKFKPERIQCNYPCGGLSCAENFEPYLIGNYFIAYTYLSDYPENNDPYVGIIIGEYKKEGNNYNFFNIQKLVGYYENGELINDDNLINDFLKKTQERYKEFKNILMKVNDQTEEYYVNIREEKVLNRKELRQKCSNENFKDDVWYDTYDLIKIKFEDYKNVIPRNFKIK